MLNDMNPPDEKSDKKNTRIDEQVPLLKKHWERFQVHIDLDVLLAAKLIAPFARDEIDELVLLSEGCANTNFKVTFKTRRQPVVLRIYVRDHSALARETQLHRLLNGKLPIPALLYADDSKLHIPHPYAVMEWIEGRLMRDIILSKNEDDVSSCAYDAGKYLSVLRNIHFEKGGFFEPDLSVRPFSADEDYFPYINWLLNEPSLTNSMGNELTAAIKKLIADNTQYIPDKNDANLTHADYDPANMLVRQIDGQWKISAILDWEFSLSSTYLLDVGLFLRFSERLPVCYEQNFIKGIEDYSGALPEGWKKTAKLMDLLCLLQLAYYNPREQRPNMHNDVMSLIQNILSTWGR